MTNNQISDSTLNLLAFGPASSVALPCGGILQAAKSLHEDVSVISGSLWPVSSVIIHLLHRKSRRFVAVDGHEEGDIESSDILSIIVPTDALSTGRELFVSQWFQRVSIEDNMTVTSRITNICDARQTLEAAGVGVKRLVTLCNTISVYFDP